MLSEDIQLTCAVSKLRQLWCLLSPDASPRAAQRTAFGGLPEFYNTFFG